MIIHKTIPLWFLDKQLRKMWLFILAMSCFIWQVLFTIFKVVTLRKF